MFHRPGITEGRVLNPSAKICLFEQKFIPSLLPALSQIFPLCKVFVPISAVIKSGPPQKTGVLAEREIVAAISGIRVPAL